MQIQDNNCLSFLDVLIMKKLYGSLAHQVYRKKTHTDKYLHAESHHHPSQKIGILHTLAKRVVRVSDEDHLNEELQHLSKILQENGYTKKDINRAFKKVQGCVTTNRVNEDEEGNKGVVILPYI